MQDLWKSYKGDSGKVKHVDKCLPCGKKDVHSNQSHTQETDASIGIKTDVLEIARPMK